MYALILKYFNNYEKFLIMNLVVEFRRNHLSGVEYDGPKSSFLIRLTYIYINNIVGFFFFYIHTAYESKDYGKVFWDKLIPYKEILLF
jgi:hypothetical protein